MHYYKLFGIYYVVRPTCLNFRMVRDLLPSTVFKYLGLAIGGFIKKTVAMNVGRSGSGTSSQYVRGLCGNAHTVIEGTSILSPEIDRPSEQDLM